MHYNVKGIELHNYPPANSLSKKIDNWNLLNTKALKKIGMGLSKGQIEAIANASAGVIEEVLLGLFFRFEEPEGEGSLIKNAREMERIFVPEGN
jgi:hypothetical protein